MTGYALFSLMLGIWVIQPQTKADPGDKVYIRENGVNVYSGPGEDQPVLMKLDQGHELTELSRQGEWVHVGIDPAGEKKGWVRRAHLSATPVPFDAFVLEVEALNDKVKKLAGFPLFTKLENLEGGMIQFTASDRWLATPAADREASLEVLFDLWLKHEGTGLPVAVYIIDSQGKPVMEKLGQ